MIDRTTVASAEVRPSPIIFWVKVRLSLTQKGFSGNKPNLLLGVIPTGYRDIVIPRNQIAQVVVSTRLRIFRLLIGLLLLSTGLGGLSKTPGGSVMVLVLAAAVLLSAIPTLLAVTSTSGKTEIIKATILDKENLKTFATAVNRVAQSN